MSQILVLFFTAAFAAIPPLSPFDQGEAEVRVRLQEGLERVSLQGEHLLLQDHSGQVLALEMDGSPFFVEVRLDAFRLLTEEGEFWAEISSPILRISAIGPLRIDESSGPERLWLHRRQGRMDIVAHLGLESYLAGVLPAEMPSSWPLSAIKAQAVAARSYTLATLDERKSRHFDVESTVMDQVYRHRKTTPQSVLRALEQTREWVLVNPRGRVLKAFYHADCGGRTIEAAQVWGGGEAMGTAVDEACPTSPSARWELNLSMQELRESLARRAELAGELSAVEAYRQQVRGRVDVLKLRYQDGEVRELSPNIFRQLIGFDRVRSTHFQLSQSENEVVIRGQGHGHGVGLCQWGSRNLAKKGLTHSEILSHYYPRARLLYRAATTRTAKKATAVITNML